MIAAALLLGGCAATEPQPEQVKLVWPPPPALTRIEFVRTFASERDLSSDTTFSQQVVNLLSGRSPPARHVAEPMGLAVSDDGQRLYVSNLSAGKVFVFDFGQDSFSEIGPLHYPSGLALDGEERLYVVEQGRRQIRVFDRSGEQVQAFAHPDIERPNGIAIDRERGRIYLVDTGRAAKNSKTGKGHSIKVFDMSGALVDSIGGREAEAGQHLLFPTYIALDEAGNLYVADTLNARVQQFDPDGNYLRTFGERGSGFGRFERPKGVALDSFGNLYVVDSGWSNVQIFNASGEVLLFFGERGGYPGLLTNPTDIAIDRQNRIYVADYLSHRINVYQLVNTTAADSFPGRADQAAMSRNAAGGADGPMANDSNNGES